MNFKLPFKTNTMMHTALISL